MPREICTLYLIDANVDDCSLHNLSGTSNDRLHNPVKFLTILSKDTVASFCCCASFFGGGIVDRFL